MTLETNIPTNDMNDDKPRMRGFKGDRLEFAFGGGIRADGGVFLGYFNSTKFYSPRHMTLIHEKYSELVFDKDYEDAVRIEAENDYPETWLNSIAVSMHKKAWEIIEEERTEYKKKKEMA